MKKWYSETGLEEDVVLSTRIRLARNLKDYKFPQRMTLEESESLTQKILNRMKDIAVDSNYRFIRVSSLSPLERVAYIEEHLISPGLIQRPDFSSFLLRDDGTISIMINEEDHLRIQVLISGLNLERGWELADRIDNFLEEELDFAFHGEFGYLTACPTNVGTGLRASAMVHLPSLSIGGYINSLINGLSKIGFTVRGLYGEGTKALGNLFQISNQLTLGEGEKEIIRKLNGVVEQVLEKERNVRDEILQNRKNALEDRVFRSLGILKYSRNISSKEAMDLISNLRLGIEMGIIDSINYRSVNDLIFNIQPASIQKYAGRELGKEERNIIRADYIREIMN